MPSGRGRGAVRLPPAAAAGGGGVVGAGRGRISDDAHTGTGPRRRAETLVPRRGRTARSGLGGAGAHAPGRGGSRPGCPRPSWVRSRVPSAAGAAAMRGRTPGGPRRCGRMAAGGHGRSRPRAGARRPAHGVLPLASAWRALAGAGAFGHDRERGGPGGPRRAAASGIRPAAPRAGGELRESGSAPLVAATRSAGAGRRPGRPVLAAPLRAGSELGGPGRRPRRPHPHRRMPGGGPGARCSRPARPAALPPPVSGRRRAPRRRSGRPDRSAPRRQRGSRRWAVRARVTSTRSEGRERERPVSCS